MSRPRANHADRLRLSLALIPWLLQEHGTSVAELTARFGLEENDLLGLLAGIASISDFGEPGFGVEIFLDDAGAGLWARDTGMFSRPLQLQADDGFAVLAAGRMMLEVPEADPSGMLASAMAKLERALGAVGALTIDVDVPEHYSVVRDACRDCESLDIEYFSAWRDEITVRRIEPLVVFSNDGRWYVIAHDSLRVDPRRRFRIDRIISVALTGARFDPDPVEPPTEPFEDSDDTRLVTIDLPPSAGWVVETYEVRSRQGRIDGGWQVVLPVTGEAWLERLLLRVGSDAHVVDPPEFAGLAARAAVRLLALYD